MVEILPIEQHYLRLAKKPVSGGVLYFNPQRQVLLVKPSYQDYWMIPGGSTEKIESPSHGARREAAEEVGIDSPLVTLLVIEYRQDGEEREYFSFIFYGGILSHEQITAIKLQEDELTSFGFHDIEEAKKMLGPRASSRFEFVLKALKTGQIIYLENGQEINDRAL